MLNFDVLKLAYYAWLYNKTKTKACILTSTFIEFHFVNGLTCQKFDEEEGDHVVPGVWQKSVTKRNAKT